MALQLASEVPFGPPRSMDRVFWWNGEQAEARVRELLASDRGAEKLPDGTSPCRTDDAQSLLPEGGEADELVERCRAGTPSAWRELYDGHFDFAYRTARRLGLPDADVEDAVQEAFEVAFNRLGDFRRGRFSTWLFRIVANIVAARIRRRRVRDFFGSILLASADETDPSPEGRVSARRTLSIVQSILRALPREKREVFALHEIEGLSHQQIADLVGARVETVRTRLFYARREFERRARRLGIEP
jgi:RNA polymerase sigma-70 factor, ECF subfamily